jgi:D-alanyl-D-alanine carboxypeptidase
VHILRGYQRHGAPSRATSPWRGRWWSLWGAVDLLPTAGRVLVVNPGQNDPFLDASEIVVGKDLGPHASANGRGAEDRRTVHGRIAQASGFASHGEPARLVHDARGRPTEFWLAGGKLLAEARVARELSARYDPVRR